MQLLSVVSAEQLRRMFERRNNFDLRRLLSGRYFDQPCFACQVFHTLIGAEPLFYALLDSLEWDLAMGTSSLHCLKLDPSLRRSIGEALVPTSKIKVRVASPTANIPAYMSKDVLYVILVAQGRVITLVRPKKHSIHPSGMFTHDCVGWMRPKYV